MASPPRHARARPSQLSPPGRTSAANAILVGTCRRTHHGTVRVRQKANESVREGITHGAGNIERPVPIRSARSALVREERGLLLLSAGRARAHPISGRDSALLWYLPLRRVSGEPAVDAGQ